MTHPLHDLRLPGPTLVLVDDSDSLALDALQGIEDLPGIEPTVVPLSTLDGPRKGWGSVLVVAADRARLRRMASAVPLLGQCKAVACWLTDAPTPWVLVPRPEWPRLVHLAAREADDRGVLTVARFASGARAQLVVMEMARQAAGPGDTTHGGLVVSYAGRPAAPGLDARAVLLPDVSGAGDAERDVPPDVVVARRGGDVAEHHVIDRAPTVVTDPGPEPVDEMVFNPIGFRKDWDHPVVDLARLVAGSGRGPVTEDVVAAARAFQGVRLPADTSTADLLALTISGVPVVSEGVLDVAPAARRRARRDGRPRRPAAPRGAQPRRASRRLRPPLHPGLALGARLARRRAPRRAARRSAPCCRPSGPRCSTSRCGRSRGSGARRSSWCWPRTASSPTATPYAARSATARTRC